MSPTPSLLGPVPFKIAKPDGSFETVTVRQLDVIELYEFIEFAAENKTPDFVALVLKKQRDFIRTLDLKTYKQIVAKSLELNFPNAMELTADPIAAARLMPLMLRMQASMVASVEIGAPSKTSLPDAAPSASAEATGSALSETQSAA